MDQFFTRENIDHFFESRAPGGQRSNFDFGRIIEETDLAPTFDALRSVIMESSFGGVLSMVGGQTALDPLQGPFAEKMKVSFKELA